MEKQIFKALKLNNVCIFLLCGPKTYAKMTRWQSFFNILAHALLMAQ